MREYSRMNEHAKLAVGVRDAAAMLSLSPRSIQNYIATNRIPARKVGKRTLILVRDLEAFLRKDQPSAVRERRAVAQKNCDAPIQPGGPYQADSEA